MSGTSTRSERDTGHRATRSPVSTSSTSGSACCSPSRLSASRRFVETVVRSREMSILLVLLALIAAATATTPSFLFSTTAGATSC
jgi:hypothetical protein